MPSNAPWFSPLVLPCGERSVAVGLLALALHLALSVALLEFSAGVSRGWWCWLRGCNFLLQTHGGAGGHAHDVLFQEPKVLYQEQVPVTLRGGGLYGLGIGDLANLGAD